MTVKYTLGAATISKKEKARQRCLDCRVNVIEIGEYYMLRPELWEKKLGLTWTDNLCIGCLEKRLDRRVSIDDMCAFPIYPWTAPTSERLLDRCGMEKVTLRSGRVVWMDYPVIFTHAE